MAVSEGLRLPRPQTARCLIKEKQGLYEEGAPPHLLNGGGNCGGTGDCGPQLINHRMEMMSGGIGPSPTSPDTLCPFPEKNCATEAGGVGRGARGQMVLIGSSGCGSSQSELPGEESSQASPQ